MEKEKVKREQEDSTQRVEVTAKKPWHEPKLTFVEPKLTQHGELKEVTGFFGTFSP